MPQVADTGTLTQEDDATSPWMLDTEFDAAIADLESSVTVGASEKVDKAEPNTIDAKHIFTGDPVFGTGDNQEIRSPAVEGLKTEVLDGTSAAPQTTPEPTFKISRVEQSTIAAAEAAGLTVGAQASHMNPALSVVCEGGDSSELQATAGYFAASTKSTHGSSRNDAGGLVVEGRALAGNGTCNAATFLARRMVDTCRATCLELHIENNTATAGTYAPSGTSDVKGIYLLAAGDSAAASAIEITRKGDQSFKVGLGFGYVSSNSAVTDASIQDEGFATTSLNILGTHTNALKVGPGAGLIRVDQTADTTACATFRATGDSNARFSIRADGRLDWGPGTGAVDTTFQRGGAGILRVGDVVELGEISTPSAPSSNRVRLYSDDNGSGKTRLMARFPTGSAVQVAIEP